VKGRTLLALLGAQALGCIDTDAAVFVEASIRNASATVVPSSAGGSFASGLGGSFELVLHLGPRASEAAEVRLGAVGVLAAGGAEIVPALAVASSPAFPVAVEVDSDVLTTVTFASEDNLLPPGADACAAGSIVFSATLDDSLRGGTLPVRSDAIQPTCP
jgi:hypothetical protein